VEAVAVALGDRTNPFNAVEPVEFADVCMSPGAREMVLEMRFVSAVALVGATVVDRVMAPALLRQQECPRISPLWRTPGSGWGAFPSLRSWRNPLLAEPSGADDRGIHGAAGGCVPRCQLKPSTYVRKLSFMDKPGTLSDGPSGMLQHRKSQAVLFTALKPIK
jgi:hypothetical protein